MGDLHPGADALASHTVKRGKSIMPIASIRLTSVTGQLIAGACLATASLLAITSDVEARTSLLVYTAVEADELAGFKQAFETERHGIPQLASWQDLTDPVYRGHAESELVRNRLSRCVVVDPAVG